MCGSQGTACHCAEEVSQYNNEHDRMNETELVRRVSKCGYTVRLYSYPQNSLMDELLALIPPMEHNPFLCYFKTLYDAPDYTGQCSTANLIVQGWNQNIRKGGVEYELPRG